MSKRLPKEQRPQHIRVGNEVFERNDVTAARFGACIKTIDRQDKDGAPFVLFAGVKYRPVALYDEFVLQSIKQDAPTQRRRRGART